MQHTKGLSEGILGCFLNHEREIPDDIFLRQPQGDQWKEYTWKETGDAARKIAAWLQQQHVEAGSRIGIWSQNCAEWIICDLAIMMSGMVSVPLYANVNPDMLHSILQHSGCQILFAGKLKPGDWQAAQGTIPKNIRVVSFSSYHLSGADSLDQVAGLPADEARIIHPRPDDPVTIIYTSGTTGTPKGVVHTYRTTISAVLAASDMILLNRRGNRFLSYLPLSHAAERGIVEFGGIYSGGSISFVESTDSFSRNMKSVLPTHFLGVPRVWHKFKEKITERLPPQQLNRLLKIPVMNSLLRKRIKAALGLKKAEVILSGAAPISADLLMWFRRLDINIREGYGLSEDFNACSLNPPDDIRIGTVGKIFPNQEVKVLPDTHEIVQRASWVMNGYYHNDELNAQTLIDGFLHTGDMGSIEDGYLTITGRVKDIFKTTKGEYIVPGAAETLFLSMDEIDQACVLGSRYPQPFLLVVLSHHGKSLAKPEVEQRLGAQLERYNQGCMGYQKLRKAIIVDEEWTPENNLLTPTLKLKRNEIARKYEEKMEPLYLNSESISWV